MSRKRVANPAKRHSKIPPVVIPHVGLRITKEIQDQATKNFYESLGPITCPPDPNNYLIDDPLTPLSLTQFHRAKQKGLINPNGLYIIIPTDQEEDFLEKEEYRLAEIEREKTRVALHEELERQRQRLLEARHEQKELRVRAVKEARKTRREAEKQARLNDEYSKLSRNKKNHILLKQRADKFKVECREFDGYGGIPLNLPDKLMRISADFEVKEYVELVHWLQEISPEGNLPEPHVEFSPEFLDYLIESNFISTPRDDQGYKGKTNGVLLVNHVNGTLHFMPNRITTPIGMRTPYVRVPPAFEYYEDLSDLTNEERVWFNTHENGVLKWKINSPRLKQFMAQYFLMQRVYFEPDEQMDDKIPHFALTSEGIKFVTNPKAYMRLYPIIPSIAEQIKIEYELSKRSTHGRHKRAFIPLEQVSLKRLEAVISKVKESLTPDEKLDENLPVRQKFPVERVYPKIHFEDKVQLQGLVESNLVNLTDTGHYFITENFSKLLSRLRELYRPDLLRNT